MSESDSAFLDSLPDPCTAPPPLTDPPTLLICEGDTLFGVGAGPAACPDSTMRWQRFDVLMGQFVDLVDGPLPGGTVVEGAAGTLDSGNGTVFLQLTDPSIQDFPELAAADGLRLRCVASSLGFADVPSAEYDVHVTTAPTSILSPPQDQFISCATSGQPIHLDLTASQPSWYDWAKGDPPEFLSDDGRVAGSHTPNLTIANATGADAGVYSCYVTNCFNQVVARTTVFDSVGFSSASVLEVPLPCGGSGDISLIVDAIGEGPFTYQWALGGTPLSDGGRISGATGPQLTIANATPADVGDYSCHIANACASTTANASVREPVVPTVDAQPEGFSVCGRDNGDGLLVVFASPSGITFQWRKDGVDLVDTSRITGTNANLLWFRPLLPEDAGRYDVRVSGDCTSIISTPCFITWPQCPADLDDGSFEGYCDGGIDVNDLLYFLSRFEMGDPAVDLSDGNLTWNSDGGVDINDLLFFLSHFEAGC